MNAASGVGPARDFSDVAIGRGSVAAIVVGYFLSFLVPAVWSGMVAAPFDLARPLLLLTYGLNNALNPIALIVGFCSIGVLLVIGYFVMAAYKGDHTSHVAAMIIGARTGAIAFGIMLAFGLLFSMGWLFSVHEGDFMAVAVFVMQLAVLFALILAAGAITALAARIAAGAPTVESQQLQADASAG